MKNGWLLSRLEDVLKWSTSHSLWYFSISTGCCADEVMNAWGCQYDLERFGCVSQLEPAQADLLILSGGISDKLKPYILEVYEKMAAPKYVISVGSCANQGGLFQIAPVHEVIPVDVYVPGCPPRPEAIMNGIIALQEKIRGTTQGLSRASQ